ncbi:unnamed protein product [Closterium sp. Yama58-4]|nr:unnamed protein product [Closterium sp. Yama58-4]
MTLAEISREKQPADAARGSIGTSWRGLVALRGFVQAGQAGVLPWDRPPPLLPDHGGQQPCAFMERTETILQPNLHLLYGWVMKPSHMIHIHKSIPFSLAENMHPSAPRVNISLEGATQRLPLYATYSHIRKAHPSWGDAVLRVLIGKPLPVGMHTEEKVLPINHEVTAVGHVRFGSDGRPAIFASPKFRYFLFSDTKAGMLQKLNHEWAVQLLVCLLLSAAAAVLVGFAVRRWVGRHGCMVAWVHVRVVMGVWVYGGMDGWVDGCMGAWVGGYRCMGAWVDGCMGG